MILSFVTFANCKPLEKFTANCIDFIAQKMPGACAFSVKSPSFHSGTDVAGWNIGNLCDNCLWIKITSLSG
jgi:hypothetical protein